MSDLTPRDKLVWHALNVLCNVTNFPRAAQPALLGQNMRPLAEALADELIERGWRPPVRVVSTVEELDALPELTVIRDREGTVAELALGMWFSTEGRVFGLRLPATVLWEPEVAE